MHQIYKNFYCQLHQRKQLGLQCNLKYLLKVGSGKENKAKENIVRKMPDEYWPSGSFGIGFQSLMPEGIKVLTKHFKSDVKKLLNINYYYGEKLIMRGFKDKIKQIKEDESLLNEFLWFLNVMVDLGSSKAYYIRENLILYKK